MTLSLAALPTVITTPHVEHGVSNLRRKIPRLRARARAPVAGERFEVARG